MCCLLTDISIPICNKLFAKEHKPNQAKPKTPTAKTFLLVLEIAPPFRLWLLTIFYAKNMEFTGGNTHTKKEEIKEKSKDS